MIVLASIPPLLSRTSTVAFTDDTPTDAGNEISLQDAINTGKATIKADLNHSYTNDTADTAAQTDPFDYRNIRNSKSNTFSPDQDVPVIVELATPDVASTAAVPSLADKKAAYNEIQNKVMDKLP